MRLTDILRADDGEYVWPFTRSTNIETIADAHRRVQSAIARPPHNVKKVAVTSCILTDTKTYESEPVLVITTTTKNRKR